MYMNINICILSLRKVALLNDVILYMWMSLHITCLYALHGGMVQGCRKGGVGGVGQPILLK